jgi:hypothetical protein
MDARFPNWPHDESFLAATLIDSPWADPDLPSYVAVDDRGDVVGFVGAQVRRLRIGDRSVRGVVSSHLAVVADHRAGLAGALLLRKMLSGPQELTWTDSASDTVLQLWEGLGGEMDYSRSSSWMLVLRPFRWLGAVAREGVRPGASDRLRVIAERLVPVGGIPVQAAGPRLVPPAFPARAAGIASEEATATAIVAHLRAIAGNASVRVDYDEPYLEHLFKVLEGEAGPLVRRIVRRRGEPIGWYAYLQRPGGTSRVLHLSAQAPQTDAVVGDLIECARADGTAALTGRAEPRLFESLRSRLALLGCAGRTLVHTRDPEIRSLLGTKSWLLTHLDGEWFST